MSTSKSILAFLFSRPLIVMILGCIAFILLAMPAMKGPLVLDSTKLLSVEQQTLNDPSISTFNPPRFGSNLGRIVAMATFAANIEVEGKLNIYSIKAVNVLFHCIAGLGVFFLSKLLLRQASYVKSPGKWALAIALCWLFAPVNFNTAMYAIQRMTQLSAVFCLVGMILYVLGRTARRTSHAVLFYSGVVFVAFPLAILSKENGILLPVFVLLIEVYLLGTVRSRQLAIGILGGFGLLGGGAIALAVSIFPVLIDYSRFDFTLSERLMSQPRAFLASIHQTLMPFGSDIAVYNDDFVVSRSLAAPLTTFGSLVALLLLAFSSLALVHSRYNLAAFGIAFFLAGHLVESTFLPLELYYPHRNYLPSVGLFFCLAFFVNHFINATRWKYICLGVFVAYFSVISLSRSLTWGNSSAIAVNSLYYHPNSPRALSNYAQHALSQGRLNVAHAAIYRAIAVHGGLNYRLQKIYIRCLSGRTISPQYLASAVQGSSKSLAIETSQALGNLHKLYDEGGCPQLPALALVQILDDVKSTPLLGEDNLWPIEYYGARFLITEGQLLKAETRLTDTLNRGMVEAGLVLLELYITQARSSEAQHLAKELAGLYEAQLHSKRLLRHFRRLESQVAELSVMPALGVTTPERNKSWRE